MMASGRGLHVAFMGIDGIGKSTLTHELADLAQRQGVRLRVVSWRSVVEGERDAASYPASELRRLWVQSFRTYFSGATTADGSRVELPDSFENLYERGGTEYLNSVRIHGLKPSGALGSAWIELAANTILNSVVIGDLVAQGYLVVQESYGYKHLLKLFAFAEHLSPDVSAAACAGRDMIVAYFGELLRPDIGVYVAGDPELALKWRQQQSILGTFETYASVGADPSASFLQLQREISAAFEVFTEKNSWLRINVVDAPREVNRRRALDALASTALADFMELSE